MSDPIKGDPPRYRWPEPDPDDELDPPSYDGRTRYSTRESNASSSAATGARGGFTRPATPAEKIRSTYLDPDVCVYLAQLSHATVLRMFDDAYAFSVTIQSWHPPKEKLWGGKRELDEIRLYAHNNSDMTLKATVHLQRQMADWFNSWPTATSNWDRFAHGYLPDDRLLRKRVVISTKSLMERFRAVLDVPRAIDALDKFYRNHPPTAGN